MKYILWIYFIIMNIIGFLSMGIDKRKAIKGAWRTPEKSLFFIALIGGGLGSWIGMYTFRHKTRHWYFVIGIPVIFLLELILIFLYLDI